jgi:DNA-directed RNA polymerase specialized sigma24 family protein
MSNRRGMPDETKSQSQDAEREFRPMFATTSWTAVVKAGRSDSAEAREALTRLCTTYWQPLHAYLRRTGRADADAKDLTQGFFYVLLSKNYLNAADRTRGKFRSFLLTALKHYLANEHDRATAAKRGGGQPVLSLSLDPGSEHESLAVALDAATAEEMTPSTLFERQWAATLFRRAEARLRSDYRAQNKEALFDRLQCYLEGDTRWGEYAAVGRELGLSSSAVAMAVHRLRHRYAEVVREEVAETLVNPSREEIEQELQYLFTLFQR